MYKTYAKEYEAIGLADHRPCPRLRREASREAGRQALIKELFDDLWDWCVEYQKWLNGKELI